MRPNDNQGAFLNLISIRRNQVISMDGNQEQELEHLDIFQKHVADRLSDLIPPPPTPDSDSPTPDPLLSIAWFRKLIDAFLCIEAEFKAFLVTGRDLTQFSKPPMDKIIPELLDRSVKALDVCNAVTHGVELVRRWQKLAAIAVAALDQKPAGNGQVRRARKALNTLLTSMAFDDKDSGHSKWMERTWSFSRRGSGGGAAANKDRTAGNFRSMSLSFANSWSAAKQIQSMSANLVAPRSVEQTGLILPVYMMSSVLVFVMWALVAAIPCQERSGLATHFQLPRQFGWAQGIIGLQDKIAEEWKKKEKKGSAGLLEEIQRMEKLAQSLVEFAEGFEFPMEEVKAEELAVQVAELGEICRRMEGLVGLQQQVREVFHSIVRSRAEVLFVVDQASKLNSPEASFSSGRCIASLAGPSYLCRYSTIDGPSYLHRCTTTVRPSYLHHRRTTIVGPSYIHHCWTTTTPKSPPLNHHRLTSSPVGPKPNNTSSRAGRHLFRHQTTRACRYLL